MDTYEEKVRYATVLIEEFQSSAINFLAENFQINQLEQEIKKCCTRHKQEFTNVMLRPRANSNQSQVMQNIQPPLSPPHNYIPPNAHFQPLQQQLPSPPTSTGSEFNAPRGPSGETILAFDGGYQLQPLSMVRANVRHNWIRADIVHTRLGLLPKPCENAGGFVNCSYAGAPRGALHATQQVLLTFRKMGCEDTDQKIFYIVYDRIGADILLGEQMPSPTQLHGHASPSPHPLSPLPQRPVAHPVLAATGTWGQSESHVSGAPTITPFLQQQQPHGPAIGAGLNVINGHPVNASYHIDQWRQQSSSLSDIQGTPNHSANASTTPTQAMANSQQIRIAVKWDKSIHPITVNFTSTSEVLCAQIQQAFPKRTLDRSSFRLRLSTERDPDAADGDETVVNLSQEEMQYDWEDAVAWIKAERPARAYARVEPVEPS